MTSTSPDGARTSPQTPATPVPAALVLEDGRVHRGTAFGAEGTAFGEAVFTTGMTGYQETLTDPSYRRQIVVATAPQIGNTGWVAGGARERQTTALPDGVRADVPAGPQDPDDNESKAIWVSGFVVRDLAPRPSNWRSTGTLEDEMAAQGVVGISGVDTRALTRHLRTAGAMRCGIFTGAAVVDEAAMVQAVRATAGMAGADLSAEVTTTETYTVPAAGEQKFTVAALDLGIKANTPRMLAARGVTTHVLPANATIDDVRAVGADGVFLSNGPGDPATADAMVKLTADVLEAGIPLFGICFGNQILGRALGLGTYKLKFGHRGINQPVQDRRSGKVLVSSQNHGFAVDAPLDGDFDTPFGRARVAFVSLNDDVVEGLECLERPAFSVQFHPEAAAGPHDAAYLFDRFVELMDSNSPEGKTS